MLGGVLYIPARWWAKRKLKESPPESNARLQITPAGFFFYGIMVCVMLFGFAQQHLAPQTEFGRFVGTRLGLFIFGAFVIGAWIVLEFACKKLGITLVRRKDNTV